MEKLIKDTSIISINKTDFGGFLFFLIIGSSFLGKIQLNNLSSLLINLLLFTIFYLISIYFLERGKIK